MNYQHQESLENIEKRLVVLTELISKNKLIISPKYSLIMMNSKDFLKLVRILLPIGEKKD